MINLKIDQKLSLVDRVEEKLLLYLKEMNLKPGDAIPGEIELKNALGVGRSVLREALSRFRMVHLLEAKPGKGMILSEPELFSGYESIVNPNWLSKSRLMDLLGFRVIIELGAIDFIFANVTDSDINDLEKIVEDEVVFEDNLFTAKGDYAFHVRLLKIANNTTVRQFQKIIYPLFEFAIENFKEFLASYRKLHKDKVYITHRDLIVFLKAREKEQFRSAMKKHLDIYFGLISEYS